jgi:AraC-like DNA-binding protein
MSLYLHLLDRWGVPSNEQERSLGGLSPRNKTLVEESLHISQGAKISIDALSRLCKLSNRQFARAFQQSFGMPFYKFQLAMRVKRAKRLLAETDLSLEAIAQELGYADQATFTEGFARLAGMPPGRFRRRQFASGTLSSGAPAPFARRSSPDMTDGTSTES